MDFMGMFTPTRKGAKQEGSLKLCYESLARLLLYDKSRVLKLCYESLARKLQGGKSTHE